MRFATVCAWAAALLTLSAADSRAQQLTPVWVEAGPGTTAVARVVVSTPSGCPSIAIDGRTRKMTLRTPVPDGFRPACEAAIPREAKSARVNGRALMLPHTDPQRVVALGDTGCRIRAKEVQDCNNHELWPFAQVAAAAAKDSPQLIIHVGDYLYREIPCPAGSEEKCGNTPAGDNWETWNADFFAPAAKLLAAGPWAFSRGNHESCERSWRGWFYYLDPRPWTGKCERYSQPYTVKLGGFSLIMLDSSETTEDSLEDAQVSTYTKQLASLHAQNSWLVDHHPFWGFKDNPDAGKTPLPLAAPLQEAWDRTWPKGIPLILSGHVHLFEVIAVDHGRPVQVVAGDGGTNLAVPIQASVNGTVIRGTTVVASESQQQFGYSLFTRSGKLWRLTLKNRHREALVSCTIRGSASNCSNVQRTGVQRGTGVKPSSRAHS